MGSKQFNNDGRSVRTTRRTMLKDKLHLITFHESISVSQWTFQLTLECMSLSTFLKISMKRANKSLHYHDIISHFSVVRSGWVFDKYMKLYCGLCIKILIIIDNYTINKHNGKKNWLNLWIFFILDIQNIWS